MNAGVVHRPPREAWHDPGVRARLRERVLESYRRLYDGVDEDTVFSVVFVEQRGESYVLHLVAPDGRRLLAKPSHCARLAPVKK